MIWGVTGVEFYRRMQESQTPPLHLESFACQKKCKHGIHLRTITFWGYEVQKQNTIFRKWEVWVIFLRFYWPTNYLRCNTGIEFFLDFFNKSHTFVVSQIICLLEKCKTRKSFILLYIMNLIHTQYCIN